MSTVVTADLAPALPDRSLVVSRSGAGLDVTLSGMARLAESQRNVVVASLERLAAPAGTSPGLVDVTSLAPGEPGFPAWSQVAGATTTGFVNHALSMLPIPADAGALRLVVREVEELHPNVSPLGVDGASELADRTVFVGVVDLADL